MKFKGTAVFTCALLAAALMLFSTGCSKKPGSKTGAPETKTVIATFDGGEVTAEDINILLDTFDPQTKYNLTSGQYKEMFLKQLIDAAVLAKAAEKEGMEKDAKVQTLISMQTNYILAMEYSKKKLKPELDKVTVSEAEMKAFYDKNQDQFDQTKIKARLITVQDGQQAQSIYEKIGSDPKKAAAVAKDSIRDMGWINRGQNFPEFESVAFALQKGQVSAPFKTRIGWNIVIVDDRSETKIMPYEQVKDSIKYKLTEDKKKKVNDDQLDKIHKEYKLEIKKDNFAKVGEQAPAVPGMPTPEQQK